MKHAHYAALLMVLALATTVAQAAEVASAPATTMPAATEPAGATTTQATTSSRPAVAATVGDKKVYWAEIESTVKRRYPELAPQFKVRAENYVREAMIEQTLAHRYLADKKITCTDKELAEIKVKEIEPMAAKMGITVKKMMETNGMTDDTLRDAVGFRKLINARIADDKVTAFIKDHPKYFDGTTVTASHILVACSRSDSTVKQKAAKAKIEKILADVTSGKVKFEDAAKADSDCPSKARGGDLGEFSFEKMDPLFSMMAYDTKVGQVSPVIRTQFGYHIIKPTARGKGKPMETAEIQQLAKQAIVGGLQMEIWALAMTTCPITTNN